jgi:cell division protein FtsQ
MDRSRRLGGTPNDAPQASRLTVRAKKNRRRGASPSLWSRVPRPRAVADACGRLVRRSVPALAVAGVVAVLVGGGWLGQRFITTSPRFAITEIDIRGAAQLAPEEVRAALPVAIGDNIFAADLDAIEAELLHAQPWLATADARRVLPHTIIIDVTEHAAAGIAAFGNELYLVDASGQPFLRAEVVPDLPVVTGLTRDDYRHDPVGTAQTIAAALDVLATWRADPARPAIRELAVDAHHALTLRTRDSGAAIQVGVLGAPLADRLRTFDAAWAELSEEERARARAFHLTSHSDRVTVAFAKD